MDVLFSPWRSNYVLSASEAKTLRNDECFLCSAAQTKDDLSHLVVCRASSCFVVVNRYPYNSGHCMIVPNQHGGDMTLLPQEVMIEHSLLQQHTLRVLQSVYSPHGFNCGMNLGAIAGAGVPDHLHTHIVPRWNGDVNFMPVVADIKVAIESLENTVLKIKQGFEEMPFILSRSTR